MSLAAGLRVKTLGLPAVLLAVLAVAACALGIDRLLAGFSQLENEEFDRTRARVRRVLDKLFEAEEWKVRDWSDWDDAAAWLEGRNPGFTASNLADSTLPILGEDLLVYWDARMRKAGGLLRPGVLPPDFEGKLRDLLNQGHFPWSGIVASDSGLVVVTMREVLGSDGSPPRRGWLAMVHRIDAAMLASLSADLQCHVWLDRDEGGTDTDSTRLVDADSVVVGVSLELEDGSRTMLLMGMGRPLHRLGQSASRTYFLHFFGAALSFVVLGLLLLERLVLFRLTRLTDGVEAIRERGMAAPPVRDPRSDEIGRLSERIDEMVDALRASQSQLVSALDEAQSANRARVNFLASMTHELRTPLNGVIGLTEFVLKTERSVESREALELSRGAALGLLETINGVLEYARLEKGVVELVLEEVDLEAAVVDPVKVLASVAVKKGISLGVEVDPGLPRTVRMDTARLRQVLNNLVGNAIKFTDKGGVVLRVEASSSGAAGSGEVAVAFEVIDTGVGIPPDRLQAIFEPFEQATSQTAVKYGGTGLGLTIASRLVNAMGGEIAVRSAMGEGSRFGFSLVLPAVDARPLVGTVGHRGKRRVRLLVADPALQRLTERVLDRMGLPFDVAPLGAGPRAWGSSHLAVLDTRAMLEHGELANIPLSVDLLVLADTEHVHELRLELLAFRAEVVALPTGPGGLAKALARSVIPKARVLVAVGGVVLRGMVVGMIERAGMVAQEARSCDEALPHVESRDCRTAVVDLDDPQWGPLRERFLDPDNLVGLVDDPAEHSRGLLVAKPVQAPRLLAALETSLENLPDAPDSNYWPDSSDDSGGESAYDSNGPA